MTKSPITKTQKIGALDKMVVSLVFAERNEENRLLLREAITELADIMNGCKWEKLYSHAYESLMGAKGILRQLYKGDYVDTPIVPFKEQMY